VREPLRSRSQRKPGKGVARKVVRWAALGTAGLCRDPDSAPPSVSVTFKGVGPRRRRHFIEVKFEHGSAEWRILMQSDEKVCKRRFTSGVMSKKIAGHSRGLLHTQACPAQHAYSPVASKYNHENALIREYRYIPRHSGPPLLDRQRDLIRHLPVHVELQGESITESRRSPSPASSAIGCWTWSRPVYVPCGPA